MGLAPLLADNDTCPGRPTPLVYLFTYSLLATKRSGALRVLLLVVFFIGVVPLGTAEQEC